MWVLAVDNYAKTSKLIAPKRERLNEAQQIFEEAQRTLNEQQIILREAQNRCFIWQRN